VAEQLSRSQLALFREGTDRRGQCCGDEQSTLRIEGLLHNRAGRWIELDAREWRAEETSLRASHVLR
jgi:hypothetical protein